MDLLGKARKLESRIARTLDGAARNLMGGHRREPLEILHAILDAVEHEVQPAGRGKRVFPFNQLKVSVLAGSRDARSRFEALFDSEPALPVRIAERLRAAGCEVPNLDVTVVYVRRRETRWTDPEFNLEFDRVARNGENAHGATIPRLELTVLHGEAEQKAYSFHGDRVDLGRCAEVRNSKSRLIRRNHVAFVDGQDVNQTVSRQHAHIVYAPELRQYRLHDDGSAHATGVVRGGRTITVPSGSRGIRLESGDELVLGEARLRVKIG